MRDKMQIFVRVNKALFFLVMISSPWRIIDAYFDLGQWQGTSFPDANAHIVADYDKMIFAVITPFLYVGASVMVHYFITGKFRFVVNDKPKTQAGGSGSAAA